jgi:hypothetical protein
MSGGLPRTFQCCALVVLTSATYAPASGAQSTLLGRVIGESGVPLTGVEVAIAGSQMRTNTDDRGAFRFSGLRSGVIELTARRLGFRPDSVSVTLAESATESVDLKLAIAMNELAPVKVRGERITYSGKLAGYYQRLQHRSSGVFITRDEIDAQHPRNLTQLLQRFSGISVQRVQAGGAGVRMRDRTCWPLIWLDGVALPSGEMDLDGIQPNTLEGVELYLGATGAPAQYTWTRNLGSCGTVLLWSRTGDVQPAPTTSAENLDSLVSSLAVFTADQVQVPAVLDTTRRVTIAYPPALYAAHTGGIVVAEFVVDTKGRVEENTFSIVSTSHALFADAVHAAITSAVFIPAVMDGRPVRQLVHQPFTFEGPK